VTLEQVEHFDREFVLLHDDRVERHEIGHEPLPDARVGLEMPDKIAVGEDPEQLLVVLKDVWSSLPEVRSMTNTREQINLLQRVVTMCIREYYSA